MGSKLERFILQCTRFPNLQNMKNNVSCNDLFHNGSSGKSSLIWWTRGILCTVRYSVNVTHIHLQDCLHILKGLKWITFERNIFRLHFNVVWFRNKSEKQLLRQKSCNPVIHLIIMIGVSFWNQSWTNKSFKTFASIHAVSIPLCRERSKVHKSCHL